MIVVRLFFSLLLLGPILLGILNFRKYRDRPPSPKTTHYAALFNAAVLYAIAFNVIFFLQELFLVLGKKALGLTAYLYHNNHSWEGAHEMAPLMQGSGALAIFVIGLLCLAWLQAIRQSKGIWKVLVMWLTFHGLIQSVPQVMVAYFDANTDVGQALVGYMKLDPTVMAVLAVASMLATAFISIWFVRPLLELAPSETEVDTPQKKLRYIRYVAVGAAFVGCLFILPFRLPPISHVIAPFLLFVFSVPWIWSMAPREKNGGVLPNTINEKIHWVPIVFLLGLFLFFRVVLAPGITF